MQTTFCDENGERKKQLAQNENVVGWFVGFFLSLSNSVVPLDLCLSLTTISRTFAMEFFIYGVFNKYIIRNILENNIKTKEKNQPKIRMR